MDTSINIPIARTRSRAAALWDEGGYDGMTGRAIVITGTYGEKLRPYFSYKGSGHRPNAKHALMPVYPGGHIVQVDTNPRETTIRVLQVVHVSDPDADDADFIKAAMVASAVNTSWQDGKPPPKILLPAIEAAYEAATRYGNIEPGYAVAWHEAERA